MATKGLLALCLATSLSAPHVGSVSRTRLVLQDDRIEGCTDLQILSLLEVLPDLDGNADGFVDASEVGESAGAIAAYLAEHYQLLGDGQLFDQREARVVLLPPLPGSFLELSEWVQFHWIAPAAPPQELTIESSLFLQTSPDHIDHVEVIWPGCLAASGQLGLDQGSLDFEPGPSKLLAWSAAFASTAWTQGALLLLALALLLGVEHSRLRRQHAVLLGVGIALGSTFAPHIDPLPGAHLLPLVVTLGAAYCAVDRAAFDMQRAHRFEAVCLGVAWGAVTRVPMSRFDLGLEPLEARLGPGLLGISGVALLAVLLLWPKGRLARALVGLVGAVALGRFLLDAFG